MAPRRRYVFAVFLAFVALTLGKKDDKEDEKDECQICKDFVTSFNKRFEETSNSGYNGGSTAWEEEKLGSYANSEVRLVEIMDSVCSSDRECHKFVEDYEEDVEKWWFKKRHEKEANKDLELWLCHKELVFCCAENRFGPNCQMCSGGPDNICSGRGKCAGSGSRFGNGTCLCDQGYVGEVCTLCHQEYYQDGEECKACDESCALTCVEGGPKGCVTCDKGFVWSNEEGCRDIDECKHPNLISCTTGTYCENIAGSYECKDCDKACMAGCLGAGPSACIRCSEGYEMENSTCVDVNECERDSDVCDDGMYCENQEGSYVCEACHKSCKRGCSGFGSHQCIDCTEGYEKVNSVCQDIDECKTGGHQCDKETEVCANTEGSYSCQCRDGYITKSDGKCVPRKTKKDKKKKKNTPTEEEGGTQDEERSEKNKASDNNDDVDEKMFESLFGDDEAETNSHQHEEL